MDPGIVDLQSIRDPSASSVAVKAYERSEALGAEILPFSEAQKVLAHPALDISDKRAILASWASDACAVESLPNWRRIPETGALVPVDDVLDALRALDAGALH
jgi:hypothetical protein